MSVQTNPQNISHPLVVIPWTWDGPSPQDQALNDPFGQLRDKYFDGETVLSLEFDLYPARRMIDPGWSNRLEASDIAITMAMNSRFTYREIDLLLANRVEIEAALRSVPTDLDLARADLSDTALRGSLISLFKPFRVPGVGIAKATKVLCLKRPRLIPMLDYWVRQMLYDEVMGRVSDDPAAFAELVVEEIELFQRILRWPTPNGKINLDGLSAISGQIAQESIRRAAASTDPKLALTPVRVLDNLLWFHNGGYEMFGWSWDETARRLVKPIT
jgi:hypothetical protein